ncbi:Creatininase OS=Chthoniobacter flavus Ellin428 GN=CfE428DRAFT_3738 PE=4 SV=1: Creatininase [Gemmata massiliana]|uniref:Creatininase n=1 Tax=Gemmata massiliana TaxID=1210884 RepID=A0A6P2DL28_9BACT|nr:creatininase family protein [Gemmata massiliana]VTS03767.1 Creatininase OS=Chthoniobacter flavus Ellin428 GN=CfE428DRAFT_3738 PE=4 SV=1: Creatininase [Gemmata massiliana]
MELADLAWPAVAALPKTTPIIFPIAALEQHGKHMPVFTDSLLLGEVIRRVKLAPVAEKCLFSPLQWLGNSHHHLDFPGTLSGSPRAYLDTLKDLATCFMAHGFTRIVFVNGHGGNITPSQQALFELKQEHRDRRDLLLLSLTYWDSAGSPAEKIPRLVQQRMGHACEWETSMVLRLNPKLVVGDVAQVPEVPFGREFAPGYRAWVMPDRSEPGHIGSPAAATAEKGEALFSHFASGVSAYLERVVEWDGSWDR